MIISPLASVLFHCSALLAAAVLPVRVTTLTGHTVTGDLTTVNEAFITIEQADGVKEFSYDALAAVTPLVIDEGLTGPAMRATLRSGSVIAAQDFSMSGSELTIEPRRQKPLKVPVAEVASIRFRPSAVTTDAQWLGITEAESRGDVMVILRPGDKLDPISGVVEGLASGEVIFDLDGDKINAPLARLEGIVFGGTASDSPSAKIQVTDVYGSTWQVMSLAPSATGEPLRLRLTDSITHELPLKHLKSMSWGTGEQLLAREASAESSYQPYVGTALPSKTLAAWFEPQSEQDDLVISGGAAVEYRLGSEYQTLAGAVRRESQVASAGQVIVRISLDGKVAWEEKLTNPEQLGFQIPLDDAKRVRIEIDPADDGDVGDLVRIIRPRLLK
ncbi:NPCBM/NEW2 domain-containing protein [Stieleria varia]|uniref:NPCBM/NEW2 domain protein n=1 Tax=Stieleria varia TaxID=2528005 RepID=A0A5C6A523_9BACT|nr:NPCBM/NEW2 domain-containing protein [Stieleria varia]TWT94398.1 NPCBM/NEW2 domain protein [Stieleria varia]